MRNTPLVFIGYDERQDLAYRVCEKSIKDRASGPVEIVPLNHRELRKKGLFTREWIIEGTTGNYIDKIDGKQFSSQFSHTRFLTPFYAKYLGYDNQFALFVDCDFVFLDDIYNMTKQSQPDSTESNFVYCVHHDYTPNNSIKMDSRVQTKYPKKLWSSLMFFNLDSTNHELTVDAVNSKPSSYLHRMEWIEDDRNIGIIDERWNFIPNHSEVRIDDNSIGAIHYTEGLPDLHEYRRTKYSRKYLSIANELLNGGY